MSSHDINGARINADGIDESFGVRMMQINDLVDRWLTDDELERRLERVKRQADRLMGIDQDKAVAANTMDRLPKSKAL